MTDLEIALLKLVQEQQVELQRVRENQLQVLESGDKLLITYKDKIIYKAKPLNQ